MDNDKQAQFEDHIIQKYQLQEFKGKGAYGVVWKAMDKQTKQIVALKKVFDAFHNQTDSQRTFREVIFLEQVSKHSNIIKLLKVIKAFNNRDLYMVFEYMETDLHKVIRANILEPIHKKYVIYQLLKAVKFLHSGDIIHRDLKPANLLINADCMLKLADFGLARTLNSTEEDSPVLTEYVATRWYRAPEILLGSQRYQKAVDMWSIGCILGEMILGKAIFPGTSTMNQVEMIIGLLGTPTQDDIHSIQAPLAQHILENFQNMLTKNFKSIFNQESDDTISFLKSLLIFNPNKRMTIEEALNHPYMREFTGTEQENIIDFPIKTLMNDNVKYSIEEYMEALYNHISPKKQSVNNVQKSIHTPKATQDFFNKKVLESTEPSTNNSENKQMKHHQYKEVSVKQTLDKFKQIESMIKQQKAKLTKNENIVLQPSKSAYGNKSMNIIRGDSSKKKEASCVNIIYKSNQEIISPANKYKPQQQMFSKMSSQGTLKDTQKLTMFKQANHKSSFIKGQIDSKHNTNNTEKFLNKKSYLQYILSGQQKLQK